MARIDPLLEEVEALLKAGGGQEQRKHLTLPDLFALTSRGNVALPVDPTHLGCLWVLDRCARREGSLPPHPPPPTPPTRCLTCRLGSQLMIRLPSPPPFSSRLRRSHTGRITTQDLLALLELCRTRARDYQSYELTAQLHGYCTLQMWRSMSQPDGLQSFSDWCAAGGGGGKGEDGPRWRRCASLCPHPSPAAVATCRCRCVPLQAGTANLPHPYALR